MLPADLLVPIETPLHEPPPGPSYVTVEPNPLSFRYFVASTILVFIVIVALVARVASRFHIALKLGWDDGLVFGAAIFSLGQTALFGLLVFGGLGHHADTVPAPNQFSIPKVLFSYELLHIISLNLGKLSALLFYFKLFNGKSIARITQWCILVVLSGSVGLVLWQFLFCRPLSKMWEFDGLETCGARQPLYVAVCAWSIFTDLLVLVVPLPIIWKLKMERTQKLRLSWLFAAGLLVTATSIVRLAYIVNIDYHDDFSFHSVTPTFLALLEPYLTILCVSLPMIYSLMGRIWPGRKGTESKNPAPRTNSRTYGSGFGRRGDAQKRSFNQIETTLPDPFELTTLYGDQLGNQREVMVSVDKGTRANRILRSMTRTVDRDTHHERLPDRDPDRVRQRDRDAESTSGSETALVETPPMASSLQTGGIMVSKDFTVRVSQRH